jgi:hypothetical protein
MKEIVANQLVLKSPQGKIRAVLGASDEETVFLKLFGPGNSSLEMCIDSDGNPKMMFLNKNDRVGINMGISDDKGHGIALQDPEGRPVCYISVSKDGIPQIQMFQVVSPTRGKKFWETPLPKTKRRKKGSSA